MKYLKTLNEYRYQMEIPFDNKHPIHDKPLHVHVQDALISIKGKANPRNYKSHIDLEQAFDEATEKAKEYYIKGFDEDPDNDAGEFYTLYSDSMYNFIQEYPIPEYPEYYKEEMIDDIKDYGIDFDDANDVWNYVKDDVNSFVTEDGFKVLRELAEREFYDSVDTFFDEIDDRLKDGVIPIWRAIVFHKGDKKDVYEHIISYGGIGEFWAWEEEKAESHWGDWGEDSTGVEYVIHGGVIVDNVNWENTIIKNVWHLKEEEEIEIKKGADVLIYKITQIDDGNYSIINADFNIDPIVVKA
jgi:hypothetical protein